MPGECRADRTEIASGNVPLYNGRRTEYGILLLYGFKENHDKEIRGNKKVDNKKIIFGRKRR